MSQPYRPSSSIRRPLALSMLAGLLLSAVPAPLPAQEAAAEAGPVLPPDSIRATGVPPLPAIPELEPYQEIRGARLADWHPTERSLLVSTRFGDTSQLHRVAAPGAARYQLTFMDEPVFGGSYRPHGGGLAFAVNEGGAENYQYYYLDPKEGLPERFTDGLHRHQGASWSNDGRLLAYVSNARNLRDFDLYVADPTKPGSERRVAELEGTWFPGDWTQDDSKILLGRYVSINQSSLWEVDAEGGEPRRLTPEEEAVAWRGAEYLPDGSVLTVTDRGSEFLRLVRIPAGGFTAETQSELEVLSGDIDWNVGGFDVSDDGRLVAFEVNEDGFDRLRFLDLATGERLPTPDLPDGVLGGVKFRPGGHEVAFTHSWARSPSDVWTYDPKAERLERWTESELGGLDPESFAVPELVRFPTFDTTESGERRTIPAFVYRPDSERFPGPRPVYVDIHGGPEGQERPGFKGQANYLTSELGVAVVYPNVRGSAGYGKSYLKLDNAELREDSVRDIGALLDWIATQEDLDSERVMVGGGSYGGYMVLASMIHYPDRLRAAYDVVGISNFVTFLESTKAYRRDLRRVEYGDERDPEMRRHLISISPTERADEIRGPLLVAQGANDPRVPLSEADQIVSEVSDNGIPVWYIVAEDEGHGFAKKPNRDYLTLAWAEFIERHLLGPEVAAPGSVEGGE